MEPATLTEILDHPRAGVRRRVREVLSQLSYPSPGLERGAYRALVMEWCRHLAEGGYGALGYPAEVGGGDDPAGFAAAAETLGHHDLSLLVKFGVQFGLFAGAIHNLGTERHRERYLRPALTLELPGCFAMTETAHGSDVRSLETTARYEPEAGEFVIDTPRREARKDYVGGAARDARLAVVFAQLEVGGRGRGVHALLVPLRDDRGNVLPGIEIEDCGEKLGLNGVDNGRIVFRGVRVPRENLLDRFATVEEDGTYRSPIEDPSRRFFTMIGTLVTGRVSVAAASVSAAKSALAIAVHYGDRRRQFEGPDGRETPLLDYLSHQRRLLLPLAATYGLHFAVRDLMDAYVGLEGSGDSPERRAAEARAAVLKALASRHAVDTAQACREACGGQGYLAENRLAAIRADTDAFTTFEGDNTVLLQLVVRALLAEYRQQFEDLDLLALVRHLTGRATSVFAEIELAGSRKTDPEHLHDPGFQLDAFRFREDHLLAGLARRLRAMIDGGADVRAAFVDCQDHVLATARAHGERLVLESLLAGVARGDDAEVRVVLEGLRSLYALGTIEADRGWFLEHGRMAGVKAKAVIREVNRLCGELRPHAVGLVDAFAIPDALLGAPIAQGETAPPPRSLSGD